MGTVGKVINGWHPSHGAENSVRKQHLYCKEHAERGEEYACGYADAAYLSLRVRFLGRLSPGAQDSGSLEDVGPEE